MARIDPWHTVEHTITYSLSNNDHESGCFWVNLFVLRNWIGSTWQCHKGSVFPICSQRYLLLNAYSQFELGHHLFMWLIFDESMMAGNNPTKLLILCFWTGKKRTFNKNKIIKKHVTLKHIILIKSWNEGGHISDIIFFLFLFFTRKLCTALRMINLACIISVDLVFSWVYGCSLMSIQLSNFVCLCSVMHRKTIWSS